MALAKGISTIRTVPNLALHATTMLELLPMFTDKIKIDQRTNKDGTWMISIKGIGLKMLGEKMEEIPAEKKEEMPVEKK